VSLQFYLFIIMPASAGIHRQPTWGFNRGADHLFFTSEAPQDSIDGWVHIEIPWEQILHVDGEEEPGSLFYPGAVQGIAFGFSTVPDMANRG